MRPIFWLIPQYNRKFSYTAATTSTRTRTDAINKSYKKRKNNLETTYRDCLPLLAV